MPGNGGDPYIRHKREAAIEPIRVVIELDRNAFQALDKASGRLGASEYLRELALERIASTETARTV
jgi:hypothetical protein